MNSLHNLFLLMFTLSQMRDKDKIMELFLVSISEMFKPFHFIFSDQEVINSAYVEEISTRNYSYGYISSTVVPDQESKSLLQNAIQMLAVILDRLKFENELKNKADSLESITQKQIIEITKYVDELETARLASLNLIEDLKEEIKERKNAELELNLTRNKLEEAQKIAHMGNFEFIAATQTTIWSEEEFRIYGINPSSPSPDYETMLRECIHPEDSALLHDTFMYAIQNQSVYELEHRIVRPDNNVRWVFDRAQPYFDNQGELVRYIGVTLDITERKQAEEKIKKLNETLEQKVLIRTAELNNKSAELANSQKALLNILEDLNDKKEQLEKSSSLLKAKNKELETFTYSVSHDLKAPLRGIDGYSRLLEEEYADVLKGDGHKFVKTIREGTKQMNQLIEDLLSYSRLERTAFRTSSINIVPFIDNILLSLKNDISFNKVIIEKEVADCQIQADPEGLTIAFRNILENAIKFSSHVENPKISISLKETIFSWLLVVKDNGIGFDMKYQTRIFEIFQRLNLPEQFPGTGIGLAMVNKTMERMNGKVWAESSPGNGATFFMELPKNK